MRLAVAGGTGTVGRHVVRSAEAAGHDVTVISRAGGVDLASGEGLDAALSGIDAVVDVVSVTTLSAEESTAFFVATTSALLEAERRAGVKHHLALSIVGIDRAPHGYYAGKVAQERLITDGGVPWTILRATQFHEFVQQIWANATVGPVHVSPRMRTQPVAAREVGDHLVGLLPEGPAGYATELAGPREESLARMVRSYARSIGHRGWIPAVPLPGPGGRAQRDGSLLPKSAAVIGTQTFDDWLAANHTTAQ